MSRREHDKPFRHSGKNMKGKLVRVGIIDRDELDARIHHRRCESEVLDSRNWPGDVLPIVPKVF
jgi:hypothetical protein